MVIENLLHKEFAIQTEKIEELIPNCEIDIIKDAGHVTNMENPDGFNSRIEKFLDKTKLM